MPEKIFSKKDKKQSESHATFFRAVIERKHGLNTSIT